MKDESNCFLTDLFTLKSGIVHWVSAEEHRALVARYPGRIGAQIARKKLPFGAPCGFVPVVGRGELTTISGRMILTADIAAALTDGGRWPWDVPRGIDYIPSRDEAAAAELARATWSLHGETLVWRSDVHRDRPAGSPAIGRLLWANRGAVVTRNGCGFLAADVKHLILHGNWPWQWD